MNLTSQRGWKITDSPNITCNHPPFSEQEIENICLTNVPRFGSDRAKTGVENIKKGKKSFFKKKGWSSRFQSSCSVGRCCWLKQPLPLKTQDQRFCSIPLGISYKKISFYSVRYKIIHMTGLWNRPVPTIMLRSGVVWSKARTTESSSLVTWALVQNSSNLL